MEEHAGSEERRGIAALLRRHALAIDVVVAAVVALLGVVSLWTPPPVVDYAFREPDALGVGLALLGAASVAVRSLVPVPAFAVATVATLLPLELGYHQTIGGLAALLTLYTVSVARPARVSASCAVLIWALIGIALLRFPLDSASDWIANTFVVVTGWAVGRAVRTHRAYTQGLEERNRALVDLRETATRAALAEERSRIAREMQDLVAHSLTEMTVQAAAARRVLRMAPEIAEEALVSVEQTGRGALEEMRRILGVLSPGEAEAQRRPQPGLDDLPDLLEQERRAGLDVTLTTEGEPVLLEPGSGLTAYRIVQEALENARVHAGHATVRVALRWLSDQLQVSVTDDGRGSTSRWRRRPDRDGHGLSQLRERTELYGGTLRAGPRRGGGFAVRASLPLHPLRRAA